MNDFVDTWDKPISSEKIAEMDKAFGRSSPLRRAALSNLNALGPQSIRATEEEYRAAMAKEPELRAWIDAMEPGEVREAYRRALSDYMGILQCCIEEVHAEELARTMPKPPSLKAERFQNQE